MQWSASFMSSRLPLPPPYSVHSNSKSNMAARKIARRTWLSDVSGESEASAKYESRARGGVWKKIQYFCLRSPEKKEINNTSFVGYSNNRSRTCSANSPSGSVRTLIALHHGRNTKSESFASCGGFTEDSLSVAVPSKVKSVYGSARLLWFLCDEFVLRRRLKRFRKNRDCSLA